MGPLRRSSCSQRATCKHHGKQSVRRRVRVGYVHIGAVQGGSRAQGDPRQSCGVHQATHRPRELGGRPRARLREAARGRVLPCHLFVLPCHLFVLPCHLLQKVARQCFTNQGFFHKSQCWPLPRHCLAKLALQPPRSSLQSTRSVPRTQPIQYSILSPTAAARPPRSLLVAAADQMPNWPTQLQQQRPSAARP